VIAITAPFPGVTDLHQTEAITTMTRTWGAIWLTSETWQLKA
jgi:hypothetical protein